jgi:hypothetical protein
MKREPPATPISTNILDYPCTMSGFERESLAAEAKLKIKAVLTVRCPTCGASRGVLCRLGTGLLRKTSHRDRRLVAKENCPSNGLPPNSRKVRRRPLRDTTTIRSILLRTHCPFPLGVSWPSPRSLLFLRSFAARTRWTRPLRAAYATKSFVRYGALAIGGGGEAQAGARSGTRDGPNPARKPRPKTVAGKKCGAWPNSMSNISRAWRMCWRCMKSHSRRGTGGVYRRKTGSAASGRPTSGSDETGTGGPSGF